MTTVEQTASTVQVGTALATIRDELGSMADYSIENDGGTASELADGESFELVFKAGDPDEAERLTMLNSVGNGVTVQFTGYNNDAASVSYANSPSGMQPFLGNSPSQGNRDVVYWLYYDNAKGFFLCIKGESGTVSNGRAIFAFERINYNYDYPANATSEESRHSYHGCTPGQLNVGGEYGELGETFINGGTYPIHHLPVWTLTDNAEAGEIALGGGPKRIVSSQFAASSDLSDYVPIGTTDVVGYAQEHGHDLKADTTWSDFYSDSDVNTPYSRFSDLDEITDDTTGDVYKVFLPEGAPNITSEGDYSSSTHIPFVTRWD